MGGYIFISIHYRTRYYALRSDGYRLLFHSAIAGTLSLIISVLLILALAPISPFSAVDAWWGSHLQLQYSGRAVLSFFLGFISWPLNFIWPKQPVLDKVLREKGDPLELLFQRAMYETKPVSLSLKSGKTYVGFVTYTIFTVNPVFPIRSVKILPLVSGYREKETLRVRFTTDYSHVYNRIRSGDPNLNHLTVDDFEVVIPTEQIQTANVFDAVAYRDYFHPLDIVPEPPGTVLNA